MSTDVSQFIADLDGGVFEEKLGRAISDVAAAVIDHGHAGKVTITLDMKQIKNSGQVTINHKLSYVRPTNRGKISDENTTSTPMYVGPKGKVTIFPENQNQLFDRKGGVQTSQQETN